MECLINLLIIISVYILGFLWIYQKYKKSRVLIFTVILLLIIIIAYLSGINLTLSLEYLVFNILILFWMNTMTFITKWVYKKKPEKYGKSYNTLIEKGGIKRFCYFIQIFLFIVFISRLLESGVCCY